MQLKSLYLRNFRGYEEQFINFSSGIHLFYGDNAQGKTNLLEAIYLLSTGKSFRTSQLKELIHTGKEFFSLQATIVREEVEESLQIYFDGQTKKVKYNQTAYASFTHLLGVFPSVLYTPNDHLLVEGAPSFRRRYLNLLLAQMDPAYVYHLSRYHRALKTRNFLLRKKKESSFSCWEKEMASSASYLLIKRKELLEKLILFLEDFQKKLPFEEETFTLKFEPSFSLKATKEEIEEDYLELLEKNRPREFYLKATSLGPHKDDIALYLGDKSAKAFASEGQKKAFSLLLKLIEWKALCENFQTAIPFSLDDFGAHFDEKRLYYFQNVLKEMSQIFLTDPSSKDLKLPKDPSLYKVHKGKVTDFSAALYTL